MRLEEVRFAKNIGPHSEENLAQPPPPIIHPKKVKPSVPLVSTSNDLVTQPDGSFSASCLLEMKEAGPRIMHTPKARLLQANRKVGVIQKSEEVIFIHSPKPQKGLPANRAVATGPKRGIHALTVSGRHLFQLRQRQPAFHRSKLIRLPLPRFEIKTPYGMDRGVPVILPVSLDEVPVGIHIIIEEQKNPGSGHPGGLISGQLGIGQALSPQDTSFTKQCHRLNHLGMNLSRLLHHNQFIG